jgi:hypothetical protein
MTKEIRSAEVRRNNALKVLNTLEKRKNGEVSEQFRITEQEYEARREHWALEAAYAQIEVIRLTESK